MLLLALACVSSLPTTNGSWVVPVTETPWVASRGPGRSSPVLGGSTVCVSPFAAHPGKPPVSCADLALNGAAVTGECFALPLSGAATLSVTPAARCEGPLPPADTLEFALASPEGLSADFAFWVEEAVEKGVALGSVRATFPPDWRPAPGASIPVAAGGKLMVAARLRNAEGGAVAWGARSAAVVDAKGARVHEDDGSVALSAAAQRYRFEAGGQTWPLPATEAAEAVAGTLSVVVAHSFDPAVSAERALGARALLRDAQGRVVFGAPVVWELEGPLLAVLDPWDAGRILVYGSCSLRGGPQEAVVRVRYGGVTVHEDLRWEEPARRLAPRDRPEGCKGDRGGVRENGGDALTALVDRLGPLVQHP